MLTNIVTFHLNYYIIFIMRVTTNYIFFFKMPFIRIMENALY